MATKADKERLDAKRKLAIEKIEQIAPHARYLVGALEEHRVDMLLLAFGAGQVVAANHDSEED